MKALIGVCVVAALAAGCNKKRGEEAKTNAPAGSAVTPPPPPPAAIDAAAAPVMDFDAHMKAGADLEDQKKWNEAQTEFEAAVAAKPDDARALSELAFTAHFAGKDDRAKEAATAAVLAAKDDKVRGSALFNLGLAIEKTLPNAAATLYIASVTARPSPAVRARLAKLQQNKDAKKPTPDGDALLAKVNVKPGALPADKPTAKPEDVAMMSALEAAGLEWESGAGKSVILVNDVSCQENHQQKPTSYECTTPAAKGKTAKAIVDSLVAHKLAPTKEHGDVVTYKAATVRCRSFNEGDSGQPDECEVTP